MLQIFADSPITSTQALHARTDQKHDSFARWQRVDKKPKGTLMRLTSLNSVKTNMPALHARTDQECVTALQNGKKLMKIKK